MTRQIRFGRDDIDVIEVVILTEGVVVMIVVIVIVAAVVVVVIFDLVFIVDLDDGRWWLR